MTAAVRLSVQMPHDWLSFLCWGLQLSFALQLDQLLLLHSLCFLWQLLGFRI